MDKELIDHIASHLQNHEEQYPQGAWERFAKKEDKKRPFVFWPLWAAAALIFMCGGVFYVLNTKEQKNIIATTKPNIEQHNNHISEKVRDLNTDTKNNSRPLKSNTLPLNNFVAKQPTEHSKDITPVTENNTDYTFANTVEAPGSTQINLLDNTLKRINLANFTIKNFDLSTEKKKPAPSASKKLTFEDLLAQDSRANQNKLASKTDQVSKWQPDVYVAPAMGNDNKVTMNYGFSLSYAIANKLSLSSGVSYASISTTESLNASAPQSLSGKNLESVNAKVRGINVPLELKYKISDKLYAGAGVSALAVLNNSQENNYIVNQVQNVAFSTSNGYADSKTMIVQEKQTEQQPQSTLDPDKYIGFYNFSLGYKQKISKKNNIAIEPFLRLPMKTFSRENLNLTNGGLRLKIDF